MQLGTKGVKAKQRANNNNNPHYNNNNHQPPTTPLLQPTPKNNINVNCFLCGRLFLFSSVNLKHNFI